MNALCIYRAFLLCGEGMNITKKLRNYRAQVYQSSLSSVIFGEVTSFSRFGVGLPSVRMAVLPCQSQSNPTIALGLWILLANLLNDHPDIQTYGIWVLPEKLDDEYEWQINDSQFGNAEWMDDDLYENALLWGKYDGEMHTLEAFLSGVLQNQVINSFSIVANSEADLIEKLPSLAQQIATALKLETHIYPQFIPATSINSDVWHQLVNWEVNLYMNIADDYWDENELLKDYNQLVTQSTSHQGQLVEWGIFASLKGVFSRFYQPSDQFVHDIISAVKKTDSAFGTLSLSDSLYKIGYTHASLDLLRDFVATHPNDNEAIIQLSQFLVLNFQLEDSIRNYRQAFVNGNNHAKLYKNYADTLTLAEYYQLPLSEFPLAGSNHANIAGEIVGAYQKALETTTAEDEKNAIRVKLVGKFIELGDEAFRDEFEKLITTNNQEAVWDVLESLQDSDLLADAIEIAENSAEKTKNLITKLYLTQLYIYDEQLDEAEELLQANAKNETYANEIERMALQISYPDYEYQMMQISEVVGANNKPSTDDVDFLEELLENAPKNADAYLLLANCYKQWGDNEASLEVLMDAHNQLPEDTRIIYQISTTLWAEDQHDLAVEYLTKGLSKQPTNVQLLSKMAHYMFESDHFEETKTFLARAEAINPRDEFLIATRVHIGKELSNVDDTD
jgi:tetratricopeptide (TPR) repeat protein